MAGTLTVEQSSRPEGRMVAEQVEASKRGPRPSDTGWRDQILMAARREFGERGYQQTTVRSIARAAGVDAKLVHYYFGTKEELFATTMAETFRARGIGAVLAGCAVDSDESMGTRYLLTVLSALEDDTLGPAFIGLVRNVGTHEESRRMFVRVVTGEFAEQIMPYLDPSSAQTRLALVGSHLLGLVMARHVVAVPWLTELSLRQLAQTLGPCFDSYLFGALPAGEVDPTAASA